MIRSDLLRAVLEGLESHRYLAREDFAVSEYANREGQPCLKVTYRYDDDVLFKFHIPHQKTRRSRDDGFEAYRFNCTMRPGKEAIEETLLAEERDGLLAELRAWIVRVYDDTVSAPLVRQFQEQAAAIDQLTARLNDLPDELLSHEDITAFQHGLDQLRVDLTDELKQHERDKDELRTRVQELTSDIEFLKQTLNSMTKRKWGDLLTARMQRWKRHFNLRQLSTGARVAKLLLPGGAAPALDTVAHAIDGLAAIVEQDSESQKPD